MPKQYKRRAGLPADIRGFCTDMTKNNIIKSAAKIAAKQSNATKEEEIIKQQDPRIRESVANFLRYRLDMTEQEFLNKVNSKLSDMVADSLNTLHNKLDEIPPQNLAYAVAVLMDKFLTVSGRPSNITASANVTLGASDMSPDQVRSILKGATKEVKKQPTKASEDKVVDITPDDSTQ
jgi:hypothetical protein|tara:strand:- start:231 stop:764 length:534 start_codon:yes stop_codon:yes gene_type:complete